MSELSAHQYWTEIENIAKEIVNETMMANDNDREAAEDQCHDYVLHEWIDGHQWVIYYAYNDDVLRHTDSEDAYKDCYSNEDTGRLIAERGLDSFKTTMAYFAMYQDVSEKLADAFDSFEAEESE